MHMSYRDWCEACVCGKARENPHRRVRTTTGIDEVEVGYLFLTRPQHPDEKLTLLVMIWAHDGALARSVGAKGVMPYMLKFVTGTLGVWGFKDIVLKSDQEQAIVALGRAVKDGRRDKTQLINVPWCSHASMGAVERMNQTLAGQIRTLRHVLQGRFGQRTPASHPVMPWVVLHAACLVTRFTVRSPGHTAYEAIRGYRSELVELGERVFAKKPGGRRA